MHVSMIIIIIINKTDDFIFGQIFVVDINTAVASVAFCLYFIKFSSFRHLKLHICFNNANSIHIGKHVYENKGISGISDSRCADILFKPNIES